jgi:hypothetical protein
MTILSQTIVGILAIASPIVLIIMARRLINNRARIAWHESRDWMLLRILVPKNNEKTPLAAEQMFAALHGIYDPKSRFQEHLSFEIAAREKYIQFYAWVPARLREFVQGQIYAQYPTAEIAHVEDYTSELELGGEPVEVAQAELVLNKNEVFPIKTFQNFEVDPLAGITSVISNVAQREQVWIQVLVRPVPDIWQTRGRAYLSLAEIHGNIPIWRLVGRKIVHFFFEFIKTIVSGPEVSKDSDDSAEGAASKLEQESHKGVQLKITKLGFSTKIRITAVAPTEMAARAKISAVVGAFKQFNTINMNGFSAKPIQTGADALQAYRARLFEDEGHILNIEELASLFHLPSKSVEIPTIVWAGSKTGEPPLNLPLVANVAPEDITVLGLTNYRAHKEEFGIKLRDRRYHMYSIGKTGTGKSTLLENMIIDDIKEGRGVAVVDPHGDLIANVLKFVPKERIDDVILFAPAQSDFPIGFNPLENVNPELKGIVASGVVGIFKKIFGESWGPRLEYILRNTVLALLDYPNATMLGITRILTNKRYRNRVVDKITDPVIKAFFVDEFERYEPKFRTEAISPIQNKVGQFLSSPMIRNIVGQPKSTINIAEIMDSGKILLLDLSIGKLGEDSAALLGAMMITKIQLASMQRAYIPEADRRDFYLYVDEFQNFATESFATILSEARKYHLNLIMTNQFIAQMPEPVASAVFGNVGTLISFRVGATDASSLVKEFEPVFEANDMVNVDNYQVYVKMSIDGVTSPAFSAQTLPPRTDMEGHTEEIVQRSQEKYGRPRGDVEAAINEEIKIDEEGGEKPKQPWLPPEGRGGVGRQEPYRPKPPQKDSASTSAPTKKSEGPQKHSSAHSESTPSAVKDPTPPRTPVSSSSKPSAAAPKSTHPTHYPHRPGVKIPPLSKEREAAPTKTEPVINKENARQHPQTGLLDTSYSSKKQDDSEQSGKLEEGKSIQL